MISSATRITLAAIGVAVSFCTVAAQEQSSQCANMGSEAVLQSPTMTVSTLNISHGRNSALNQMFVSTKRTYENLDKIVALFDKIDADVVALQEADAKSKWSGKFDHVQYLVENSRLDCYVHGRQARSWLYSYGTALLSKSALADSSSFEFKPTPPTTTKGFVRARIDWSVNGKIIPVTIVSVHLDFSRRKVRDSQIAELIEELGDLETELIIMGDLNSTWSDKRPHIRQLAEGLELTAYDPDGPELGTYQSVSGKRLDWILISSNLEFLSYEVLPDVVADHLAVTAEIRVTGD